MSKTNLWTKNFIALIATNGLLFASFHVLLPTLLATLAPTAYKLV